jgi:hypothetical protein
MHAICKARSYSQLMDMPFLCLFFACAIAVSGCAKQDADFDREVSSPTGQITARFAGYQPRGTIDGHLTVTFAPRSRTPEPQITLGHMLGVKAGWLDDRTFAFVFDLLDQRDFTSPIYPTGEASSAVQIVSCNQRYLDCGPILKRLTPAHSVAVPQFPEGSWPADENNR